MMLDHAYFSNTVHLSLLIQVTLQITELIITEEQYLPNLAPELRFTVQHSVAIPLCTNKVELFMEEGAQM